MSVYTPDSWRIVKIQAPGHDHYYRIIAGWGGGYLYGANWKLSSGIESLKDNDGIESFKDNGDYYVSDQSSGSVYKLHKSAERMSGIMSSIFATYNEQATDQGWTFEVISLEDFLKEYNGKIESI